MPTLYIVRHGEPALKGVMLGHTDPPLSAEGRRQIATVNIPARVIYTSPLKRAVESAGILAHDAPIVTVPGFAEISFGEWDGRTWADIESSYPELAAQKLADWTGVTPPHGEPWSAFVARIESALAQVLATGTSAAIVGHIAVNACIAAKLAGEDPISFQQEYGAVRVFEVQP